MYRQALRCLRYCKSTIFQANHNAEGVCTVKHYVVCDTAKVRFFKQITTTIFNHTLKSWLFAILQKYDFSSKSQHEVFTILSLLRCLRYCKSTIFQANHNYFGIQKVSDMVVCDTAKVRFFKQITTHMFFYIHFQCCLRYCKSTIFQANHNQSESYGEGTVVVCDTAKVRFFKQITTIVLS